MRTTALAAMIAVQAPAADAPLQPASAWNVEYGESMCVVSRDYGDKAARVTIGFRPTPFADMVQGVTIGPRNRMGRQGPVRVVLATGAGDVGDDADGTRVHLPDSQRTLITYFVSRATFEGLAGVPVATIRASGSAPVAVALSMGRSVLAAARACEVDLMRHWGYDPAKIAAVATPAEGIDPAQWLSADDYPVAALNARQQGRVLIGWTISDAGRVVDCRTLQSSGSASLDGAACDAVTRRGRYRPARDAAGRPVESYATRSVVWLLPGL